MDFTPGLEAIDGAGYSIRVFVVPWDTAIFGFPVAQIERIEIAASASPDAAMDRLGAWLRDHQVRLASCRLPSLMLRESMALESTGFRFVEMVYAPILSPLPTDMRPDPELVITEATSADLPAIEAIAGAAFSTGRHLLDWRLDGDASHRRYRVWVRNAFNDPGQRVLTATLGTNVVGFFIVETRDGGGIYWHLTAVAPGWQGRGLGRRIWATMVASHAAAGARRIDTAISGHNARVMNIYAGLGFRFGLPMMTLHWVNP